MAIITAIQVVCLSFASLRFLTFRTAGLRWVPNRKYGKNEKNHMQLPTGERRSTWRM